MKSKQNKEFTDTTSQNERTDRIIMEGTVVEVLPHTLFRVECGKSTVLCTLAGKLRQNKIRIIEGDYVKIEVSVYDLSRGRLTWRK